MSYVTNEDAIQLWIEAFTQVNLVLTKNCDGLNQPGPVPCFEFQGAPCSSSNRSLCGPLTHSSGLVFWRPADRFGTETRNYWLVLLHVCSFVSCSFRLIWSGKLIWTASGDECFHIEFTRHSIIPVSLFFNDTNYILLLHLYVTFIFFFFISGQETLKVNIVCFLHKETLQISLLTS